MNQDNYFNRAFKESIRLLKYRERSRFEIEYRLKHKGFSQPDIEKVVKKLMSLGYINDERFAEMWIKDRVQVKPMGSSRLKNELRKKGISSDIIDNKISWFLENYDEFELAQSIIQKRLDSNQPWDKIASFLWRRGFNAEIIKKIEQEHEF